MVVKEDQRQAKQFTTSVRELISSSWCLVFGDSLTRLVDEIGLAKLPTNSRVQKFNVICSLEISWHALPRRN